MNTVFPDTICSFSVLLKKREPQKAALFNHWNYTTTASAYQNVRLNSVHRVFVLVFAWLLALVS